jgi:hypothetical protein
MNDVIAIYFRLRALGLRPCDAMEDAILIASGVL